jgi:hypothetical protein
MHNHNTRIAHCYPYFDPYHDRSLLMSGTPYDGTIPVAGPTRQVIRHEDRVPFGGADASVATMRSVRLVMPVVAVMPATMVAPVAPSAAVADANHDRAAAIAVVTSIAGVTVRVAIA